jgi:hypothetical protein
MVRLNCSGITFGSQLDEKHLFSWASEISCVVRWEQDTLVVRSLRISEANLRELLAIFWRYEIPMAQLAQFQSNKNMAWFAAPKAYWHKKVFGQQSNNSFKADGAAAA